MADFWLNHGATPTGGLLTELFRRTNQLLAPIFERSWFILLATHIGCEISHQYFTFITKRLAEHSSTAQIPATLGDICVSLIEFVVLIMLIPQRVIELDHHRPAGSFWEFTFKHTKDVSVESIRSLAVSLLWFFLLIVPGVVKYVRYFFVPYVVVADPDYQKGQIDALEESERLVKGISWPLFIVIVILTVVEFQQQSLREKHLFISAPFWSMIENVGFFAVNYYTNVWLFVLYQQRVKKLAHLKFVDQKRKTPTLKEQKL